MLAKRWVMVLTSEMPQRRMHRRAIKGLLGNAPMITGAGLPSKNHFDFGINRALKLGGMWLMWENRLTCEAEIGVTPLTVC